MPRAEKGIGLAATQVDIHQRIIVIDVSENRDERLVLINPELLEKSGETGIEEPGGNPGRYPSTYHCY
nr:peptide deformylase [Escherichia coli]